MESVRICSISSRGPEKWSDAASRVMTSTCIAGEHQSAAVDEQEQGLHAACGQHSSISTSAEQTCSAGEGPTQVKGQFETLPPPCTCQCTLSISLQRELRTSVRSFMATRESMRTVPVSSARSEHTSPSLTSTPLITDTSFT